MSVEIVDFAPHYAKDFETLNREWLEALFRVEDLDAALFADPEKHVIRPGGSILFALQKGKTIGTVALKRHRGGRYELTRMAVTASCRGEGIGRLLLEAAIDRFKACGGSVLYLESHSSLAAAIALYESAGFRHETRAGASPYERADVYMVYRG